MTSRGLFRTQNRNVSFLEKKLWVITADVSGRFPYDIFDSSQSLQYLTPLAASLESSVDVYCRFFQPQLEFHVSFSDSMHHGACMSVDREKRETKKLSNRWEIRALNGRSF